MQILKRMSRAVLPGSLAEAVSTYRTLRRSQARHRRLRKEHACELPASHIANIRLLPGRADLLKLLPAGGVVAEVGVARGEFSRQILDVTRPQRLHLIDLWDEASDRYGRSAMEKALDNVRAEADAGVVVTHRGYSWEMLDTLEDGSLDWAYLDAAHDYECVERDLAAARRKVKAGGIICGHDYTTWSTKGIHRYGVVEAVNEFCVRHDWEMLYLTNECSRNISYAIRPRT